MGLEFKGYFDKKSLRERGRKLFFDLVGENKRQLLESGVTDKNILDVETCTVCENKDFYSYRIEKEAAGRMVSFITA